MLLHKSNLLPIKNKYMQSALLFMGLSLLIFRFADNGWLDFDGIKLLIAMANFEQVGTMTDKFWAQPLSLLFYRLIYVLTGNIESFFLSCRLTGAAGLTLLFLLMRKVSHSGIGLLSAVTVITAFPELIIGNLYFNTASPAILAFVLSLYCLFFGLDSGHPGQRKILALIMSSICICISVFCRIDLFAAYPAWAAAYFYRKRSFRISDLALILLPLLVFIPVFALYHASISHSLFMVFGEHIKNISIFNIPEFSPQNWLWSCGFAGLILLMLCMINECYFLKRGTAFCIAVLISLFPYAVLFFLITTPKYIVSFYILSAILSSRLYLKNGLFSRYPIVKWIATAVTVATLFVSVEVRSYGRFHPGLSRQPAILETHDGPRSLGSLLTMLNIYRDLNRVGAYRDRYLGTELADKVQSGKGNIRIVIPKYNSGFPVYLSQHITISFLLAIHRNGFRISEYKPNLIALTDGYRIIYLDRIYRKKSADIAEPVYQITFSALTDRMGKNRMHNSQIIKKYLDDLKII